jgi:RND family efflux transporter MFP subunit
MLKKFLKLPVLLALAAVVIVGSVYLLTRRSKVAYQYEQINSGKITESVSVSGAVKAAEDIDLSFQYSGKISQKYVSVGDQVKAGQVLLTLDNADAAVQLAQAQAALNKQLAGNRPEYIAQLQAGVDQAKASLDQVSAVSDNSVHTAETTALTAENNLKLASGGETSQIVEDAYDNMTANLQSVQNSLANALTKADNILGVDNNSANDGFENLLSVKDIGQLNLAKNKYTQAKSKQQIFFQDNGLLTSTDHNNVDAAADSADSALVATQDLLNSVTLVLNNTITGANLSGSDLDNMKTTIQTARADISAKRSSLNDQKHAISTAKNSYTTFQIAFNKAEQDLNDIKNKTKADVAAAKAALDKANSALADAKNPPREVDLASFREAVSAAQVNYSKTILTAPFDGKISRQDGELGQLAMPNVTLVSIISNNKYQVEVFVAETDVAKIKIGDQALITLDDLADNKEFSAKVIKIDPAATTQANGISAYKITLQFDNEDARLKVGLTANVKIIEAEKDTVLIIPAHDVVQKDGQYFVMTLNNQQTLEQKPVQIGLKGENDQWEIISGLQAGDSVVSFSSSNK